MSYSAGVLPFTIKNGTVYFLLGRDRSDGAFSDFGGKAECVDDNDPKRTAVREFYEETAGTVLDLDACAARLQEDACHDVVVSRTMGGNEYRMYIVQIPYLSSYPRSFEKTMRFLRYMKANRKFLEKTELAWFSLDSLMAAVRGLGFVPADPSARPPLLRNVFACSLRVAESKLEDLQRIQCYPKYESYAL